MAGDSFNKFRREIVLALHKMKNFIQSIESRSLWIGGGGGGGYKSNF